MDMNFEDMFQYIDTYLHIDTLIQTITVVIIWT